MAEFKTLTTEQIKAIETVADIDPELIHQYHLDTYEGLSEKLISICFMGCHTPNISFALRNNVTEDQFLKVIKGGRRSASQDIAWKEFFEKAASFKSDAVREAILGNTTMARQVLDNSETLFGCSRVEVLSRIIEMDRDGAYKKSTTGYRSRYHTYNDSPLKHVIRGSMLSEEEKELLIEEGLGEQLFRCQFLSMQQLQRIGADLNKAWHYYVLENPDKYRPLWTNKGDCSMVGVNMPGDWFYQCQTSKKPEVQMALARYCPEQYLPLMIGNKTKEKWGNETVEQVVEGRMSGDPQRVWKAQFGK